ncbi:MAG: bifunctional demethylmenaquinone methyltransferase/2-methoxy-6-polyprenyl-1,4-benzoquinol methylase UbiE [Planctomycetales bacterium]|nr:bifunctional demethylmenaquinone methyltransferase/2-methoxy-6-polyprenyl-1,4-benzoquinol methylase UbiE [Planctomycetales bacterium]
MTDCYESSVGAAGGSTTNNLDKSGERIRSMFASIAKQYDRMNHLLSMNIDRYWRRQTVKLVPPRGDNPILDVCTGTGDLALAYRQLTGGQPEIMATDFCPEMLEIGREKQQARGLQQGLTFREADTTALPFPDNQFQIVSVAFGLRNVCDTDQGLQEMKRVCQPGGRVAILEFSHPTIPPLSTLYGWYFRYMLPRVGQLLNRNNQSAYSYLPASVGQFPSGQAMADRMTTNGLQEVRFYPFTLGVATLYVGVKPDQQ